MFHKKHCKKDVRSRTTDITKRISQLCGICLTKSKINPSPYTTINSPLRARSGTQKWTSEQTLAHLQVMPAGLTWWQEHRTPPTPSARLRQLTDLPPGITTAKPRFQSRRRRRTIHRNFLIAVESGGKRNQQPRLHPSIKSRTDESATHANI